MSTRNGFKISYALSLATQLGFLIVASIGGFILLGVWLDGVLGIRPFALVGGIIIGVALTAYEVHHLMLPLLNASDTHATD